MIATAEAAKEAQPAHHGSAGVSVPTVGLTDTVSGAQFAEIEEKIGQLGVPYTFLRLPAFAKNLWGFKCINVSQGAMISVLSCRP